MKNKSFTFGSLVAFLLTTCLSCTPYQDERGIIFNTTYTVKYESPKSLYEIINKELQDFSMSLNPFNPNSIISKVNRNEDVEIDDKFRTVFLKAMEVSEKSDGAFDATVSPLINLWGFGYEQKDSISQHTIDSIKTFVGYKKIRIENNKVIKDDPRITLNFSAIAKGYACDVIGEALEREGVQNYLVCIGGEILSKGKRPNGECWRNGINKPEDDITGLANEVIDTLVYCDKKGLATSGNYRNFHYRDGKKYGHTIDPKTGYPTEQDIVSASIIAPDCMTADAYATAFMVMGVEAACRMAESIPEIEYYLLYNDAFSYTYQKKYSPGIRQMLKSK